MHVQRNRDSRINRPSGERGYALLTLTLTVALLALAVATAASSLAFNIRRDREEELIHRGAEYSRAIRRYTKKMGRYPLRVEDLENTDGLRFLRKRYKDPITGKDFRLLHLTDLQLVGIGGLGAPAAAQGSTPGNLGAVGGPAMPSPTTEQAPSNQISASTPDQSISPNPAPPEGNEAARPRAESDLSSQRGLGVIVGVVSTSRHETIREFNGKNHYSDWLFFYDPAYDRGFEITGPTKLTKPTGDMAPLQPSGDSPSAKESR